MRHIKINNFKFNNVIFKVVYFNASNNIVDTSFAGKHES